MAIDPRILKIGGDRQVNLNVTPGTVQEQGRTIGGRFQVGAPQQSVGPSGEESLYQSLSYIAGGVVDSAQNISQLAALNNDILWNKWYDDQWQGPNSKRRSILEDPEVSREDKRKKLVELLDAAPTNGNNKNRKAQLYGDWLDQDPDATSLFQEDYAKFQEETLSWSPEDRLRVYLERFNYELQAGMPQAMSYYLGYQKDLQNHTQEVAVTQGKLSLERTAGFMQDVFEAVLANDQGDPVLLDTLRQEATSSGSLPQLEQVIGQVDLIRQNGGNYEAIESVLRDTLGIEANSDRYSPYNHLMQDIVAQAAYRLSRSMGAAQAESNAKFEQANKDTNRRVFSVTPLPTQTQAAAAEVLGLLSTVNIRNPADMNSALSSLMDGIIETINNSNMGQVEAVDYTTNLLVKTWETATPAQRQTMVAAGLVRVPKDSTGASTLLIFQTPSYAESNRESIKQIASSTLNSNSRFTGVVERQINAAVAPYINTAITGLQSAGQLPILLKATASNLGLTSETYEQNLIQVLVATNTSNVLLGEGGRNVWNWGLGFPPNEYDLYVAANQGDQSPEAKALLKKYGSLATKDQENEGIAKAFSEDNKVILSLNRALNRTLQEIGSIKIEEGKQSGVFTPAQLKEAASVSTDTQSGWNFAKDAFKNNPAVYDLALKANEASNGLTYNTMVGNERFSFAVPVASNGITINNLQLLVAARLAQQEINELKKTNPTMAAARATIAEEELKKLATRTIVLTSISNHPAIVGDKPDEIASQRAAATRVAEAALATESAFTLLYKDSDLDTSTFYGPVLADSNLSTITIVDDSGTLDQGNYARAVFMVRHGMFTKEDIKSRMDKAFADLSARSGNIEQMDKGNLMFLFAIADGIASKAVAKSVKDPTTLQSSIDAQILMMSQGSDIKSFVPSLRSLVALKLATNQEFIKGDNRFTVNNPDNTISGLTDTTRKALGSEFTERSSRMAELAKRKLKAAANLATDAVQTKNPLQIFRSSSWSNSGEGDFNTNNQLVFPFSVLTTRNNSENIANRNNGEMVLKAWTDSGWQIAGNTSEQKQRTIVRTLASTVGIPFKEDGDSFVVGITIFDDNNRPINIKLTDETFGFIVETLTTPLRANPNFSNFLQNYREAFPDDTDLTSVMSYWNDESSTFFLGGPTILPDFFSYEVGQFWTGNWMTDPEQALTGNVLRIPAKHNNYVNALTAAPGSYFPNGVRNQETVEEDIPGSLFDREEYLPGISGRESTYATLWLFGERSRISEAEIKEDLTTLAKTYYGEDLNPYTIGTIEDAATRLAEDSKLNRRARTNAALLFELEDIVYTSGRVQGKGGILPPDLLDVGNGIFSNAPGRKPKVFSIDFAGDATVRQMVSDDSGSYSIPLSYGVPFDPKLYPLQTNETITGTTQLTNLNTQLDFIREFFVGEEGSTNFGHPWLQYIGSPPPRPPGIHYGFNRQDLSKDYNDTFKFSEQFWRLKKEGLYRTRRLNATGPLVFREERD